MQTPFIKKFAILAGAAIAITAFYVGPTNAQDATTYLKIIAQNTTNILSDVNQLPTYIAQMLQYALNVQMKDDSQTTQTMQSSFASTGKAITDNMTTQLGMQATLNADLLGSQANKTILPYANDLVYSTLLGQPVFNPDPRNRAGSPPSVSPPYNYVKNAAGMSVPHVIPQVNWNPRYQEDYVRYSAYYSTATAVESYNGYVLSNQLADMQNGNGFTNAQTDLIKQAGNSDWIATISSEEIGKVLRQLLMFESQSYVLTTQLLQTQKQLLAAQAMTNALLIAVNQQNETMLLAKAQGQPPR